MSVVARYQTDPKFRALVEAQLSFMRDNLFTLTEIKQAVILAALKREVTSPAPDLLTMELYRSVLEQ